MSASNGRNWSVGNRCRVKTPMGTWCRAYIKSIDHETEMVVVKVYGVGGGYTAEYRMESLER